MYSNHPIFLLSDELTCKLAELAPTMATYMGIPGHDHRWEDHSPAGHARNAAAWRDYRARLAALDPGADPWLALAKRALDDQLEQWVHAFDCGDHLVDLNSIASPVQHWRMVFDVMDTGTAEGWANVAARLEGLSAALAGYRETLTAALAERRVVARRQVETVREQCGVHAGDTGWFAGLPAQAAASPCADDAMRARIAAGALLAREAYAGFARFLVEAYLPHAAADDAVGADRYARAAVNHLGLKLDAPEAYSWAWNEIRRLEAEIRRVTAQIDPSCSVPELVQRLKMDPTTRAASREDFVRLMTERQLQALAQLDGVHFDVPAGARRIDVKVAPPGGPLGAYYMPASEDFSRPGCVWYSMGDHKCPPLFAEISTAYHEGFPGHHLQICIQIAQAERLSRFQRVASGNTGHAEGWALYAEQLMLELGYFERPEYELGMYIEQLVRAWRVVVDIGLHLKLPIPADSDFHPGEHWNHELMLEAMHRRAHLGEDSARSEVIRYMGWPAQAIAYKLGQRTILALREERRAREGAAFSLKRFHARVLEVGSVGLDLLAKLVREPA